MSKPTEPNVEMPASHFEILGQYYYALGHGASGVHILRQTTAALYERYKNHIHPEDWAKDGVVVLYWIEQIGRTAAQMATSEGKTEIDKELFEEAADRVEGHVKRMKCGNTSEHARPLPDGKYCHN